MKFHSVLISGTYIIPCLPEILKNVGAKLVSHGPACNFYSHRLFSEHIIVTMVNWNLLLLL